MHNNNVEDVQYHHHDYQMEWWDQQQQQQHLLHHNNYQEGSLPLMEWQQPPPPQQLLQNHEVLLPPPPLPPPQQLFRNVHEVRRPLEYWQRQDQLHACPYFFENLRNGNYGRMLVELLPTGFRFVPSDVELITVYLQNKVNRMPLPPGSERLFLEVDLYDHNPEELIGMHTQVEKGQKAWYFFTSRERKYRRGNRPQRTAGDGYWKATGVDDKITTDDDDRNHEIIGYKKVLDFYTGKHPDGTKTDWKMHEYITKEQKDHRTNILSTTQNPDMLDECVLCKVYKIRKVEKKNNAAGEMTNTNQAGATTVQPNS